MEMMRILKETKRSDKTIELSQQNTQKDAQLTTKHKTHVRSVDIRAYIREKCRF